jgi:GT2 family glycosyltransferase
LAGRSAGKARRSGPVRRRKTGRRTGYTRGYSAGYNAGYNFGFDTGVISFQQPFEGTSIIIPTYNQGELLKQCIESIGEFTTEPHEIIIIDNASTDGTADYLRSIAGNGSVQGNARLRYRINMENIGFAGGVNQGLKMARGSTLLLLNNDTIVTRGWLTNLLGCLHSDERIGLVGPMTNYISGAQLVAVPYKSTEEMHRFAEEFNRPDPAKWMRTERITGFCLLFRRDLFDRLGYFDEGFEMGNCEDDDFCLRVLLLGHELVIAGDTFIHHVGSVSMKSLGDQMGEVYARNLDFYGRKWGDAMRLAAEAAGYPRERRGMLQFYPDGAHVKGNQGVSFRLTRGTRQRLLQADGAAPPPVRLSHVELRGSPLGEPLDDVSVFAGSGEGLLRGEDGVLYRLENGKLRRFVSPFAFAAWGFAEEQAAAAYADTIGSLPHGLPIIAPVTLRSANL